MINYYLLMKPGILMGNLITVAAGFLLASKGEMNFSLFLATLLGLGLIMASGCVLNNYIDKPLDKKMERTKNRALVTGLITGKNALIFAFILGLLGCLTLLAFTNLIATLIACFGFFVYVIPYSLWKSHTVYGTAIGSISGAIPPVVGYCAAANTLDLGGILLFILMILWQMPHFFAIALYRLEDYTAAAIPVLPLKKGIFRTKIHMTLYIIAFIGACFLLTYFNYTGYTTFFIGSMGGLAWLLTCLNGFTREDHAVWGRLMFRVSLIVITVLSLVISLDSSLK